MVSFTRAAHALADQLLLERLNVNNRNPHLVNAVWNALLASNSTHALEMTRRLGVMPTRHHTSGIEYVLPRCAYSYLFARFAVHPLDVWEYIVPVQPAEAGLDHPLHLASAMLYYDVDSHIGRKIAEIVIDPSRLDGTHKPHVPAPRVGDTNDSAEFWKIRIYNPTFPEDFGLPRIDRGSFLAPHSEKNRFAWHPAHIDHLNWLSPAAQSEVTSDADASEILSLYRAAQAGGEEWVLGAIRGQARALVHHDVAVQPNYWSLSYLVRLMEERTARRWLRDAKGVRRALGVVRSDATTEEMRMGLREMFNSTRAYAELYDRIGRPLTIEDLKGLNHPLVADLLWKQPYENLKELLVDEKKIIAKLAVAIGSSVSLSVVQDALVPHEKRPRVRPYIKTPTNGVKGDGRLDVDWHRAMHAMLVCYEEAGLLRDELQRLAGGDDRLAFLLALRLDQNAEDSLVETILTGMDNYEEYVELRRNQPYTRGVRPSDIYSMARDAYKYVLTGDD